MKVMRLNGMIQQGKWIQVYPGIKSNSAYELIYNSKVKVDVKVRTAAGVGRWINENCYDKVISSGMMDEWWFMNKDDAVLFKLVWC